MTLEVAENSVIDITIIKAIIISFNLELTINPLAPKGLPIDTLIILLFTKTVKWPFKEAKGKIVK